MRALALCLLLALPAAAEEVLPEVWRGVSLSTSAGPLFALRQGDVSTGPAVTASLAWDLGESFSAFAFGMGAAERAPLHAPGDWAVLAGGAGLLATLHRWPGADHENRLAMTVRVAAGWGVLAPSSGAGPFALVAPGLAWNARLRHFAIGLELPVAYGPGPLVAVGLSPTLKYTF